MNDELTLNTPRQLSTSEPEPMTQGMSSLFKLLEAFIALREKNERQHKLFEQAQNKTRDTLVEKFNSFVSETHRAYQSLRQELTGEKKVALMMLNELLDVSLDLERIVAAKPVLPEGDPNLDGLRRWVEGIEIENRKVQESLRRAGVHPYDAVVGQPYNPALHERVGSRRMEGMDPHRVAEQREHGYASQIPDFVLRRPKVIVSE